MDSDRASPLDIPYGMVMVRIVGTPSGYPIEQEWCPPYWFIVGFRIFLDENNHRFDKKVTAYSPVHPERYT